MKDWKRFYEENKYLKFAVGSAAAALLALCLLARGLLRGTLSGGTLEKGLTVLALFALLSALNFWRWKRARDGR